MNNTYKVSEILFGLRESYLKNRSKLQELQRMCMVDYTKVDEYRFYLYDDKIFCDYCENVGLIRNILGLDSNGRTQVVCVLDKNKKFSFIPLDEGYPIKFIENKKELFLEKADEIRNSSFTKSVNNLRISDGVNFDQNVILINPFSMNFTIRDKHSDNLFRLSYVSSQNLIKVISNVKKVSAHSINNLFKVEFNKDYFPDDIKLLIENSLDSSKQVYIEPANFTNDTNLRILEDDKFILEKTKRRW